MVRASGLALRLAVAVAACALVVRGDEFDAPTPRPAASPAKKPSASDGADPVSDEIWTTMTISATAFVALSLLFDLLRSHLWWVYGPRLHHAKYRAATPPDPGPGPFRWVAAVARLWSDAEFLEYAGVDGLVMIQFLNFAADQAFFAALVGCAVLVPTYVTARGLRDAADDDDASYGFSLTTVSNIHCAKKDALGKQPLFPKCLNQNSNWRFAVPPPPARDAPALDGVPEEGRESGDDHLELSDRSSSGTADRSEPPELLEDDPWGSVDARSQVDEVEALALDGFRDARRLSEDMESAAEAAGRRRTWSREMWRARAVPDPVPRHVPRYGTLFNAFYGCCCGAFDGCFVESIPFYEQTVDALNREILRAHFAHMLLAERTSKPRLRALIGEKKRRNHGWRGCFWAIDDDDFSSDSDDDEPAAPAPAPATPAAAGGDDAAPTPTPAAAAASARRRNRRLSHLQASGALRRSGDDRRQSVDPVAKYRDRHWLSVLASDPPSQAVPAVARRVALSARKVVRGWCSSTTRLVTLIFDWDVEDEGLVERSTYQVLPIAALLSIVNLLPLCFQAIARFYERLKSHSAVDLSVVERFFRFQFINVYVSILANAILKDLQKAWHSP
ncbi:hypothetical protein JL722_9113 [Aureococcus anophagefferens]|nr:hypothetical protein JL722_9113 [Aureococcus anophagefferens]